MERDIVECHTCTAQFPSREALQCHLQECQTELVAILQQLSPLLRRLQDLLPHTNPETAKTLRTPNEVVTRSRCREEEANRQPSTTDQAAGRRKVKCPHTSCPDKHRKQDLVRHWASKHYPRKIRCHSCSKTQKASVFMKSRCAKDTSVGQQQYETLCEEIEGQMGISVNRRPRNKTPDPSGSSTTDLAEIVLPTREDRAPVQEEMSQQVMNTSLSASISHSKDIFQPHLTGEFHSLFDMPFPAVPTLYDYFEQTADQSWESSNFPNQDQYIVE